MSSVAGQIRIDLLANTAKFSAGLQQGRREARSFADEMAKIDRQMATRRSVGQRNTREQSAWRGLMEDASGGYMFEGEVGSSGWKGRSLATRRDDLLRQAVPWGQSYRTTLSREAAETAAAITKAGSTLKQQLGETLRGLADQAGVGGPLATALSLANKHPLAVLGAVAGGLAIRNTAAQLGRVRDARETAQAFGQPVAEVSRLQAVGFDTGNLAHFYRAMKEGGEVWKSLGLNAEKLKSESILTAFNEVGESFRKIASPVDRSAIAMELFGRSGAALLPVLSQLKEKLERVPDYKVIRPQDVQEGKATDLAKQGAENSLGGMLVNTGVARAHYQGIQALSLLAETGLGALTHMPGLSSQDEAQAWAGRMGRKWSAASEQWGAAEANIENADALEQQARIQARADAFHTKRVADAKAERKAIAAIADEQERWTASAEQLARNKVIEEIEKAGGRPFAWTDSKGVEHAGAIDAYDQAQLRKAKEERAQADRTKGDALRESVRSAEEIYRAETEPADELYRRKAISEETYARLRKRYLEDYYRSEYRLDAKRLDESTRTGLGVLNREREGLAAMRKNGLISEDARSRGERDARDKYRASLGVSDPYETFRRKQEDLAEALKTHDISTEEYDRQTKRNKNAASGDVLSDYQDVQLMGAAKAGSSAAYSMLARSEVSDPKVTLAQETNKKLDAINESLKTIAAGTTSETPGGNW
jgi:hypothetical protein